MRSLADVAHSIIQQATLSDEGCLVWQHCMWDGYGRVRYLGEMVHASRVMWEAKHGEVLGGLHVLHTCDNRACVNVEHLFLGTNRENIDDKCTKDRSGRKLTIDKVNIIRRLAYNGMSQNALAAIFGVNQSNISRAVRGERWAYVPGFVG